MSEFVHVNIPTAEPPKCDFCSSRPVVTCFKSVDAGIALAGDKPIEIEPGQPKVKNVILSSDAHWGACADCAPLVRKEKREAIYQRSLAMAPAEIKNSPFGATGLRLIQDTMFWAGFEGKEHPASEHPLPSVEESGR